VPVSDHGEDRAEHAVLAGALWKAFVAIKRVGDWKFRAEGAGEEHHPQRPPRARTAAHITQALGNAAAAVSAGSVGLEQRVPLERRRNQRRQVGDRVDHEYPTGFTAGMPR